LSTALSSIDPKLAVPAPAGAVPGHAGAIAPAPTRRRRGAVALPRARSRWWLEALLIVWLCWVYDAVNNLAPLRLGAALDHGQEILSAETALGIAPERALDHWLAGQHALGLAVSDYYDNAHFIVTLSLLGFLWWRRADIYRRLRNVLVLINLLGFVVFWLYPVAPPRMLAGFTDVVASSDAVGSWHTGALASAANQMAAMPSLHIAWAVWCTVAVWRISSRPALRALGVAYPCLTGFAVLSTGNHYVLDVLGGIVLAAAAVAIVSVAPRARARMRSRGGRSLLGTAG
jgi:PAP2 superfamily